MKNQEIKKGEIVIYKAKDGPKLYVRLEKDTVWLTQKQMALLFDKELPTINEHIKNIYKEGELKKNSTIRKFRIVQSEGSRTVERKIDFYNLDVIISVGYRVKSQRGTQFRIWATKTLKSHIVKGYSINEKRLLQKENQLKELQTTIDFLQKKSKNKLLAGQEQEILNLLANYSKTLTLPEQYDKQKLTISKKPIASFLFVYFLDKNNYLYRSSGEKKINDNALVVLSLLIAISSPKDKEILIKIITNLLGDKI